MYLHLLLSFITLCYTNDNSVTTIISQKEYFDGFDVRQTAYSPRQWWLKQFKFLVDHGAFYEERIHFIGAIEEDGEEETNGRLVDDLRKMGWNASLENVHVLEAEISSISSYENNRFVCRILRTDAIGDNPINYRFVINIRENNPYTIHEMYMDHPWCKKSNFKYTCPLIYWCSKHNWSIPIIKIDTRTY